MPSVEPFLLDPANRAYLAGGPSRRWAVYKVRLGLMLVASILLLCLFVTGWAGFEWLRWLLLQGNAEVVSAQVLNCRKDTKTDGEPGYYVSYRFEAATPTGPRTTVREQSVGKNTFTRLSAGHDVNVRYNRTFPSISAIVEDTSFRDGISIGALMWLPVGVFMGWQVRRCRREIRLGGRGRILDGRVSRCTGKLDAEGDHQVTLHYRFTVSGGRVLRGEGFGCRNDLRDLPLPGRDTPVKVLFLDDNNYKVL